MRKPWPVEVSILPDEILSSWLVRTALAQGCDPLVLTGVTWPKYRFWTRDVDRGLTENQLSVLAKVARTDAATIEASCLRATATTVCPTSSVKQAIWPWMLAVGARNRKRRGGLQYCPLCLAEDKIAYYRRPWRFAWHFACKAHGCMLLDGCPHCGAPIEPHRLLATERITSCARCKSDLRKVAAVRASVEAFSFQATADNTIASEGTYGGASVPCAEWFKIVRYFAGLVRKVAFGKADRLKRIVGALGVDPDRPVKTSTGLQLEMLPVEERQALLVPAWKLVKAGPDKFRRAAHDHGATRQMLFETPTSVPSALRRIMDSLPSQSRTSRARRNPAAKLDPRSRWIVMRSWARLRRKMLTEGV